MKLQKEWLIAQCEEYQLNSEQFDRIGIYYVNNEGDLLVSAGDGNDRFNENTTIWHAIEISIYAEKHDYKEVKKQVFKESKAFSWWENRFAQSFARAFCLSWKRADIDPSDKYFQKDLAIFDPEHHVDEVCNLDVEGFDTEQEFESTDSLEIFEKKKFYEMLKDSYTKNKVLPGYYDPNKIYGQSCCTFAPLCDIIAEKDIQNLKGYKMAARLFNINEFMDEFGWIGWSEQRRPYEMLADLEQHVSDNWQKSEKISSYYILDYLGDKSIVFQFSHFEINNDLFDETYSCVFACYKYVGTVK